MVRIKTCRLTRNPQLGDPVAWLNLTPADGRELDHVALHRSPGCRWFFQGWAACPPTVDPQPALSIVRGNRSSCPVDAAIPPADRTKIRAMNRLPIG